MTMLYSPSANGFYTTEIHKSIPEDAVEISNEMYHSYLNNQDGSKKIVVENGKAVVLDRIIKSTWDEIRSFRDKKLSGSDWSQMIDSPLSDEKKKEWQVYRQTLRDLTSVYSDASAVVWPSEPAK